MPALTSILTWSAALLTLCHAAPTLDPRANTSTLQSRTSDRLGQDADIELCVYSDNDCGNGQICRPHVKYGDWVNIPYPAGTLIQSFRVRGHSLCGAEGIAGNLNGVQKFAQAGDSALGVRDDKCYSTNGELDAMSIDWYNGGECVSSGQWTLTVDT